VKKSPDAAAIQEDVHQRGYVSSVCDDDVKSRILMLIGLSYVLPKKWVSFLIRKKWYRFLPTADHFGHFNESVYYLSSLLKPRRARNFIGFRADEFYKLRYLFSY
jgi:hypothetical protein